MAKKKANRKTGAKASVHKPKRKKSTAAKKVAAKPTPKPAPKANGTQPVRGATTRRTTVVAVSSRAAREHGERIKELLRTHREPLTEHRIGERLGMSRGEVHSGLENLSRSGDITVTRVVTLSPAAGLSVCEQVKNDLLLHSPTRAKECGDRLSIDEEDAKECLDGFCRMSPPEAKKEGDQYSKV
jgi:hypothetical protein